MCDFTVSPPAPSLENAGASLARGGGPSIYVAIAYCKKIGAGEAALRLRLTCLGEAFLSCSTTVAQTNRRTATYMLASKYCPLAAKTAALQFVHGQTWRAALTSRLRIGPSQQRDLAMRRSLRSGSACVLGRVENAMRTRVKSNHAERCAQNSGTFGERRTA